MGYGSYAAHLASEAEAAKAEVKVLSSKVRQLEEKVRTLERYNKLLQSKLDSFFTGDVPNNATFEHMILAKYGRVRLQERSRTAALLAKKTM